MCKAKGTGRGGWVQGQVEPDGQTMILERGYQPIVLRYIDFISTDLTLSSVKDKNVQMEEMAAPGTII